MRYKKWMAAGAAMILFFPSLAVAKETMFDSGEPEEFVIKEAGERASDVKYDDSDADQWFYSPTEEEKAQVALEQEEQMEQAAKEEKERIRKEKAEAKAEKKKQKEEMERHFEIFRDDSFVYKLERDVSHYRNMPGSIEQEKILDVWVKLEPVEVTEEEYTYPAKYYLEHYLIRPKTQQVQFLCELEVTGRPSNDVQDKKYDSHRWENLVPGSIEDTIYHAVMKNKGKIRDDSVKNGTSIKEYLDRTFHIAL